MTESEFEFPQSETFGLTSVGKRRSVNQDQFLIAELSKSMLVSASSLPEFATGRFLEGSKARCCWWPMEWAAMPPVRRRAAWFWNT